LNRKDGYLINNQYIAIFDDIPPPEVVWKYKMIFKTILSEPERIGSCIRSSGKER
jgi:hypothetical protein